MQQAIACARVLTEALQGASSLHNAHALLRGNAIAVLGRMLMREPSAISLVPLSQDTELRRAACTTLLALLEGGEAHAHEVADAELRDECSVFARRGQRLQYTSTVLDRDAALQRRRNPVTQLTHRAGFESVAAHTMHRGHNRVYGLGDRSGTHGDRRPCEKKFIGSHTSTKAMFGI